MEYLFWTIAGTLYGLIIGEKIVVNFVELKRKFCYS